MRSLIMVMIFAGLVWMICNVFYILGKRDAIKEQKRKADASSSGRKKVESFVVENDNRNSGDNKK